jgi:ribosomal protein S18 acetylase RimI-like enzyme
VVRDQAPLSPKTREPPSPDDRRGSSWPIEEARGVTVPNPCSHRPGPRPQSGGSHATAQSRVKLVRHGRLPLVLLLHLDQLRLLFDANSFWAQRRSRLSLVRMLLGSSSVVSAWRSGRLVGFGRATSDGVFRAVLWDVVVDSESRGQGLGRDIVETLLSSAAVASAERVYLMTTNSSGFYTRLGFSEQHGQRLMVHFSR